MQIIPFDQRPLGIQVVGKLPWGSHFCVLYASQQQLLDVLVPFIKTGLECNEACLWEISDPLTLDVAAGALARSIPDLEKLASRGQIELLLRREEAAPSPTDEALERRLDDAILKGFEGLRLVRPAGPSAIPGTDSIRRCNIIAAFAYPRAHLGGMGLMQVVQDHRFALVYNSGRWDVLEGSQVRSARDALRRSEEKQQSLFRNMWEGFAYCRIILDAQSRPCDYVFLEVNPAFEGLTGLPAQNVLGRRATQLMPGLENDPADWIGRFGRVALTREPARFERFAVPLRRWYAVSAFSPHKGYFAVTFADITQRKQAEAERAAAEERLMVTLRSIGDAVIATDTQGRITLMNGVAESLTGWTEAESCGRPLPEVFQIVNEETGAPAEDPVIKVIREDRVVGLANHTALIAKDGRRTPIADSAAPVKGPSGPLGAVLVFRDVAAQRQAERERELTIEFLRLINANGRTDDLIKAATNYFRQQSGCRAVGIRLKQGEDFPYRHAQGFSEEFLSLESPLCARDDAGELLRDSAGNLVYECTCGKIICGGVELEQPFFSQGGSFWVNDSSSLAAHTVAATRTRDRCQTEGYQSMALIPLRVGEQRLGLLQLSDRQSGMFSPESVALWERLAHHLAVALARSRAEDELARANHRLELLAQDLQSANTALIESDGRKNEFLAMLSHELRNPLAPISNSLYVLEHAALGRDQAKRAMEVIKRQVGHLSHLVNDLLDVTRISSNKIQLQVQRIDLCDVVRRSIEDQRSLFERADIKLEAEVQPAPLFITADPNRVAQVIGNLLQNAAKFTRKGGLTRVSVAADRACGQAVVRVIDTGMGIAPEMLPNIFKPFMQADETLDRSRGGLGLGLALVKGVVELHGGQTIAHSNGLGKGSEFVVRLPLEHAAGIARSPGEAPRRPRSTRVLVIEDNIDAADSLLEVLRLSGHEVAVAYSGSEGIASARLFKPALVLCDIGLPGMDGYEVARTLRADASLAGTRLVALSGYALPEDVQRALEAGFHHHMPKPPNLKLLEELLALPASEPRVGATDFTD